MIGSATSHEVARLRNRVHQWVWTLLVGLVAGVGGAIAILAHGLSMIIGFGFGCAVVVLAVNVNVTRLSMQLGPAASRVLTGALTGICALGWFEFLGWTTGWLGAAVVLSSPWVHERCRTSLAVRAATTALRLDTAATRRAAEGDGLAGPDARPLRALSDHELGLAWKISTLALTEMQYRGDIANQAGMISLRQSYLDEFSIRRRAGFDDWLSAGAWLGGDSAGPNDVV